MARIRTVKPDFFQHYELYELEKEFGFPLRVAFSGLWTVCDREGRFRWVPQQLKLSCLPYDDVDFSRVLDALSTRDFIKKYVVDGREYGYVPSFLDHQVINNRETQSKLPEPNKNNTLTREFKNNDACPTREVHAQAEGKGREGKGRERKGREGEESQDDSQTVPLKKDLVREVFEHWQIVMNHPKSVLDNKREKIISDALKDPLTVEDLKLAIDGCSKTPHNMGNNDQGQRYDGIHIIFKPENIDRFIANAENPPVILNKQQKLESSNHAIVEAYMANLENQEDVVSEQ